MTLKIDAAVCLCLDKRENEWRNLIEQGKQFNLDIHPFICGDGSCKDLVYSKVDEKDPDVSMWGYGRPGYKQHHYNAFKCHQKIISLAKYAQFNNILILEDDAYITDRFSEVLNNLEKINAIPEQFDILYLGWWVGHETDQMNESLETLWNDNKICGIRKAYQIGGLHGALINSSMFDTILNMQPIDPIDCQLNKIHRNINSYYIFPKVIHTKTTYSYCEGSIIERKKI